MANSSSSSALVKPDCVYHLSDIGCHVPDCSFGGHNKPKYSVLEQEVTRLTQEVNRLSQIITTLNQLLTAQQQLQKEIFALRQEIFFLKRENTSRDNVYKKNEELLLTNKKLYMENVKLRKKYTELRAKSDAPKQEHGSKSATKKKNLDAPAYTAAASKTSEKAAAKK